MTRSKYELRGGAEPGPGVRTRQRKRAEARRLAAELLQGSLPRTERRRLARLAAKQGLEIHKRTKS